MYLIMKNDICISEQERSSNKYISLRGYFYAVFIIGCFLIIAGIMSMKAIFEFSNLLENLSSDGLAFSTSSSNMNNFGTLFFLLTYVFLIAMLIWVYLAYKNIRILAGQKSHWTPVWAVISYFIPGLNLWLPWQIMQEIVHKSASEPLNKKKVGIYTAIWCYGLILAVSYIQLAASGMQKVSIYDSQWSVLISSFRQMGYSIGSYLLVVIFILWFTWHITSMQEIKIKILKNRETK